MFEVYYNELNYKTVEQKRVEKGQIEMSPTIRKQSISILVDSCTWTNLQFFSRIYIYCSKVPGMCIQLLAIKIKEGYMYKQKKIDGENNNSVEKNAINANKYETRKHTFL